MANTLIFKLSSIMISVTMLIMVPLMKNNFYAPVTISTWKELTWDDFHGFVRPFTGWGAGISSTVYLEYDSMQNAFYAYSGQNNQLSWTKEKTKSSGYALNHEQYHFNLTEVLARKLNLYIKNNTGLTEGDYQLKLYEIRLELSRMQSIYDDETDHSLNADQQRRWEYKIDSLLLLYANDNGALVDQYSGAQAFFPTKPTFSNGSFEDYAYRNYQLDKYDMNLAITSFQLESFDIAKFQINLNNYYKEDSIEITSWAVDSVRYEYEAKVESIDSLGGEFTYHNWVYHKDYLYRLTASHPFREDIDGYKQIARSFVNSFDIVDTDDYWISKLEDSRPTITHMEIERTSGTTKDDSKSSYCAQYVESKQYGFYKGPIYLDDGGLIIVYSIFDFPDSLIYENLLLIKNDLYKYSSVSADQIFFVPAERLPEKPYEIEFGFLLKEDTIEQCFDFYYQSKIVEPSTLSKFR